ncbi:36303_t:CDS:2 [Gigaspora margarita]|uniref:36303_t:CDS:1 n=1 Tax=Gigaspora margarita TaxID=4874 RepID=A0ABM8W439_GIGMA|nr:36303_t:CDS:2 [Gigaspora margarita]
MADQILNVDVYLIDLKLTVNKLNKFEHKISKVDEKNNDLSKLNREVIRNTKYAKKDKDIIFKVGDINECMDVAVFVANKIVD